MSRKELLYLSAQVLRGTRTLRGFRHGSEETPDEMGADSYTHRTSLYYRYENPVLEIYPVFQYLHCIPHGLRLRNAG